MFNGLSIVSKNGSPPPFFHSQYSLGPERNVRRFVPPHKNNIMTTNAFTAPLIRCQDISVSTIENIKAQKNTIANGMKPMRNKMSSFEVRLGYPGSRVFAPQCGQRPSFPAHSSPIFSWERQPLQTKSIMMISGLGFGRLGWSVSEARGRGQWLSRPLGKGGWSSPNGERTGEAAHGTISHPLAGVTFEPNGRLCQSQKSRCRRRHILV